MTSIVDHAGLDRQRLAKIISRGLDGADDGELFLEYRQAEALTFDNGRLKQATYDTSQGFGLRAVKGEAVGCAHASDVSEAAIERAADAVRAVKSGYSGRYAQPPPRSNVKLYGEENPLSSPCFEAKARLLQTIDAYARAKDPRVRQVTVSLAATWQAVEILRGDGETYRDIRPLVRVNVSVVVGDGSRQETGSDGYGGRESYERFIAADVWQSSVDKAVRQALINLEAAPAPAGEMDVVLGPGWPASCCMKQSAMASKAISIGRRRRLSPGLWGSVSPPRASSSSMTAQCRGVADPFPSMMKALRPIAPS